MACVQREDLYDTDREHTGQIKNGIHRENVYMCIGEEVEDGAHCLGVVCWMKRIQKERTKDSSLVGMKDSLSTAKTTLGELVLDQDNIVTQGNSWQSRR